MSRFKSRADDFAARLIMNGGVPVQKPTDAWIRRFEETSRMFEEALEEGAAVFYNEGLKSLQLFYADLLSDQEARREKHREENYN